MFSELFTPSADSSIMRALNWIATPVMNYFRDPATVPPPGEPTDAGYFIHMPPPVIKLIAEADVAQRMMTVSRKTRALFRDAHRDKVQRRYLHRVLRLQPTSSITIPDPLRHYVYPDAEDRMMLTASTLSDLNTIDAFIDTCYAFGRHYQVLIHESFQSGWKVWSAAKPCLTTGKSLNDFYNDIELQLMRLPTELVEGTALGVLHASSLLVNTYNVMLIDRPYDGQLIRALAVKGLGGAQLSAGRHVLIHYLRESNLEALEAPWIQAYMRDLGKDLCFTQYCGFGTRSFKYKDDANKYEHKVAIDLIASNTCWMGSIVRKHLEMELRLRQRVDSPADAKADHQALMNKVT